MPGPEETPVPIRDDESLDGCLRERFRIIQKVNGFRYGVDALLLADWAAQAKNKGKRCIDLGTGTGVIPFILALRTKFEKIVGIELFSELVEMAERSARYNKLDKRVLFMQTDVRKLPELMPAGRHDLVTSNPPYLKPGTGRMSPNSLKAGAKHELNGTLEDFVSAAAHLVSSRGKVCFIYTAVRTAELLAILYNEGLWIWRMRFVHSFPDSEATFVLVEARKKPVTKGTNIQAPLNIFDKKEQYSKEMARILGDQPN